MSRASRRLLPAVLCAALLAAACQGAPTAPGTGGTKLPAGPGTKPAVGASTAPSATPGLAGSSATPNGRATPLVVLRPVAASLAGDAVWTVAGNLGSRDEELLEAGGTYADEGKARFKAFFYRPTKIALEPKGSLLVQDDGGVTPTNSASLQDASGSQRLRRIGTDGKVRTLNVADDHLEFVVAPDGTVYIADGSDVFRLDRPGEPVFQLDGVTLANGMACGPDETLYVCSDQEIVGWKPGDADARTLGQSLEALGVEPDKLEATGCMAVDLKGRMVLTSTLGGQVVRWDPATKAVTAIAGPGTSHFAGTQLLRDPLLARVLAAS